jgi:hypothetical protein
MALYSSFSQQPAPSRLAATCRFPIPRHSSLILRPSSLLLEQVMEDVEESQVPVAASLESRSNRKKMPASTRGGRGRGRGSAAATAKPTAPFASTDMVCIPHVWVCGDLFLG